MSKIYLSVNNSAFGILFHDSSLKAIAELLKTAQDKGFSLNDTTRALSYLMSLIDVKNNYVEVSTCPYSHCDFHITFLNNLVKIHENNSGWMSLCHFYDVYHKPSLLIPKKDQVVIFKYNTGSNPGYKTVKVDNACQGHIYGYDLSVPNWKAEGYRHYKAENITTSIEVIK